VGDGGGKAAERIGILTGGGDCPGLNAVIRAVVRRSERYGRQVIGFRQGWKGALEGDWMEIDRAAISGILHKGGTILKTSRTNPAKEKDGLDRVIANCREIGVGALIAIGGEDTLGVASKLQKAGFNVVGVPKTIDNDLIGTEFTFGFDTAVSIATEAIDRLHTTAESHNRVMVVEVMGRYTGWIALYSGLAGGADAILVPEVPGEIEAVCASIRNRHELGKDFSIVVVAEGARLKGMDEAATAEGGTDAFGHVRLGGVANLLAKEIGARTGYDTRVTVLGHTQRGGSPTARDRILATQYGVMAADLVHRGEFGKMAALQGGKFVAEDLAKVEAGHKEIPMETYRLAEVFFG
jgi:6-phosphofructokinase 1